MFYDDDRDISLGDQGWNELAVGEYNGPSVLRAGDTVYNIRAMAKLRFHLCGLNPPMAISEFRSLIGQKL